MAPRDCLEIVGAGIEYSWGKAKQRFRRDTNGRVAAHLHRNIVACMSREEKFLPVSRERKFARRTRAYRRAYREGQPNSQQSMYRSWSRPIRAIGVLMCLTRNSAMKIEHVACVTAYYEPQYRNQLYNSAYEKKIAPAARKV